MLQPVLGGLCSSVSVGMVGSGDSYQPALVHIRWLHWGEGGRLRWAFFLTQGKRLFTDFL